MAKRTLYRPTTANIQAHALEPSLRWLIAEALDGGKLFYGELKKKLEDEAGFRTIFSPRMGWVAGLLMNRIQDAIPDAPLINVLVVNQNDRQPGLGAGAYLAKRFKKPRLAEQDAKTKYPQLWEVTCRSAADEVYAYGAEQWAKLYRKVFGAVLSTEQIDKQREDRRRGEEQDGVQTGRDYGAAGEGKFHRELRQWVKNHPEAIHGSFAGAQTETESNLDSGDRIDVVYKCADRIVLLEVKSRVSNEIDLKRGVYQCIKYRAVRAAMDVRDNPLIETYLITEMELPGNISALLRLHKVKHFQAPQVRR